MLIDQMFHTSAAATVTVKLRNMESVERVVETWEVECYVTLRVLQTEGDK